MHAALNNNLFLVKEHLGIFKASNNYDIYDPNTQQVILECREERLGWFTKMLRFTDYKRMTPFEIDIKTPEGEVVLTVKRGVAIFLSTVEVLDGNGKLVGKFKQKLFSIGGKFQILDASERPLCMLKGKWTGWNFKFVSNDGKEFAQVSKKWSGIGKELFTSADNYILQIEDTVPADNPLRILIMAAIMCIDFVLKE